MGDDVYPRFRDLAEKMRGAGAGHGRGRLRHRH
jgi:hypothetical protein